MLSLEEGRPAERERAATQSWRASTLDEYLERLVADAAEGRDPCLFFDQFEELFTLDPTDHGPRRRSS